MSPETRRLTSEVTGIEAVTSLIREVGDLFYFQEPALTVSRISSFQKGITRSDATPRVKNDFHYQLKSLPYFGYLKQKKVISQWLLPAPDSRWPQCGLIKSLLLILLPFLWPSASVIGGHWL